MLCFERIAEPLRAPTFGGALFLAACASVPAGAASDEQGWGEWQSRGGELASFPDCDLHGTRIDCWARGSGGLVWNRYEEGAWAGWKALGGPLRAAPSCVEHGDSLSCFAARLGGGSPLLQFTYLGGDAWAGPVPIGGSAKQQPACITGPGQAINCFALGGTSGNSEPLFHYRFDGTAWHDPVDVSVVIKSTLRPECVDRAGGIDCLLVDTQDEDTKTLYHARLVGDTWTDWGFVTTEVAEPPQCLVQGQRLDCISRSTADLLVMGSYDGESWGPWTSPLDNVGVGPVQSRPYCNPLGSGFDCYWTTPHSDAVPGELWRRQFGVSGWLPAESLGRPPGGVQMQPVCLAQPGGQHIDCFVRGGGMGTRPLWQRSYR